MNLKRLVFYLFSLLITAATILALCWGFLAFGKEIVIKPSKIALCAPYCALGDRLYAKIAPLESPRSDLSVFFAQHPILKKIAAHETSLLGKFEPHDREYIKNMLPRTF